MLIDNYIYIDTHIMGIITKYSKDTCHGNKWVIGDTFPNLGIQEIN